MEGVIADFNLSLGGLIGFMAIFFGKMGITNLRFKPAYNPVRSPAPFFPPLFLLSQFWLQISTVLPGMMGARKLIRLADAVINGQLRALSLIY